MGNVTRKSVNDEIDRYINSGDWTVLHDHTEPTSDGKFFRMVALQYKYKDCGRIILKTTAHWSEPVSITVSAPFVSGQPRTYDMAKKQYTVNWSSGGTVPGASNNEIAHAMIAMWSWVQHYLKSNET